MRRNRDVESDSDSNDMFLDDEDERKISEEENRINQILQRVTPEQRERYFLMKKANFYESKNSTDDRLSNLLRSLGNLKVPPSSKVLLAVNAAAKIYIGEIVEEALKVAKDMGHTGPVSTKHLHQARLKLKKKSKRIL